MKKTTFATYNVAGEIVDVFWALEETDALIEQHAQEMWRIYRQNPNVTHYAQVPNGTM